MVFWSGVWRDSSCSRRSSWAVLELRQREQRTETEESSGVGSARCSVGSPWWLMFGLLFLLLSNFCCRAWSNEAFFIPWRRSWVPTPRRAATWLMMVSWAILLERRLILAASSLVRRVFSRMSVRLVSRDSWSSLNSKYSLAFSRRFWNASTPCFWMYESGSSPFGMSMQRT